MRSCGKPGSCTVWLLLILSQQQWVRQVYTGFYDSMNVVAFFYLLRCSAEVLFVVLSIIYILFNKPYSLLSRCSLKSVMPWKAFRCLELSVTDFLHVTWFWSSLVWQVFWHCHVTVAIFKLWAWLQAVAEMSFCFPSCWSHWISFLIWINGCADTFGWT